MAVIADLVPYRQHIDRFDMTDGQKLELIKLMHLIAEQILDRQFGLNQPDVLVFEVDQCIEIQCLNGTMEAE